MLLADYIPLYLNIASTFAFSNLRNEIRLIMRNYVELIWSFMLRSVSRTSVLVDWHPSEVKSRVVHVVTTDCPGPTYAFLYLIVVAFANCQIQIQGFTYPVRAHFLEDVLEMTGYKLTSFNQIDDFGQEKMWKTQRQLAPRKKKNQITSLVEVWHFNQKSFSSSLLFVLVSWKRKTYRLQQCGKESSLSRKWNLL